SYSSSFIIPCPPTSTLFPYTTLFRSESASKQSTTSLTKRFKMRVWLSVNAVPCGATTFVIPASNKLIKSSCPSQTTAQSASIREIGRAPSELQSRSDLVCRLLLEKKK